MQMHLVSDVCKCILYLMNSMLGSSPFETADITLQKHLFPLCASQVHSSPSAAAPFLLVGLVVKL